MRLNLVALDSPENGHTPDYVEMRDQSFHTQRLVIDNHHLVRCKFDHCTFVHSGGPFAFGECEIDGYTRLLLTGPARRGEKLREVILKNPERPTGAF